MTDDKPKFAYHKGELQHPVAICRPIMHINAFTFSWVRVKNNAIFEEGKSRVL